MGIQSIPRRRRNNWETGRIAQDSRMDTRPALARGEWGILSKSITRGAYMNAGNETVWLWANRQLLMADTGRNGRNKKVEKAMEQGNKDQKRQVGELRSDNWGLKDELHNRMAENKKMAQQEVGRIS